MKRSESQGHGKIKSFHKEIAYLVTSTSLALRGGTTSGIGGDVQ